MIGKSLIRQLEVIALDHEHIARSIRVAIDALKGLARFSEAKGPRKRKRKAAKAVPPASKNGFGPLLQGVVAAAHQPLTRKELLKEARAMRKDVSHQAIGAAIRYKWLARVKGGKLKPGPQQATDTAA